jgi:hypothetical protein
MTEEVDGIAARAWSVYPMMNSGVALEQHSVPDSAIQGRGTR